MKTFSLDSFIFTVTQFNIYIFRYRLSPPRMDTEVCTQLPMRHNKIERRGYLSKTSAGYGNLSMVCPLCLFLNDAPLRDDIALLNLSLLDVICSCNALFCLFCVMESVKCGVKS